MYAAISELKKNARNTHLVHATNLTSFLLFEGTTRCPSVFRIDPELSTTQIRKGNTALFVDKVCASPTWNINKQMISCLRVINFRKKRSSYKVESNAYLL